MNIIILSNRFFSIYNSRQKIISSLAENGHKVTIFAKFDGFEEDIQKLGCQNIKCVNFNFSVSALFLKKLISLQNLMKNEEPDLVHAFNPLPIFVSAFLSSFLKYKLIITITGLGGAYGHNSKMVMFYNLFYIFSIIKANQVVFQNEDDYQYFLKKIPKKHVNKINVIKSSGVDITRFKIKKVKADEEKKPFKILFISRLIKQKGINYLIEAARRLSIHSDIEIHIYGEYNESHNDAISQSEYQDLLNLKNITFHGFEKNIEKQYTNHDLLICCSLREGVPRVILEASASGVPVVAYNVTGVREGVEHGINGFLVPAFNVDKFEKDIMKLKSNKLLYEKISRSSRMFIKANFSQKAILKEYLNIYKQITVDQ